MHATKCANDGWLGFNHVVISRANGHKTHGNFPFAQKRYNLIILIKYYNYSKLNIFITIINYNLS
jgi:hypothetical protein